MKNIAVFFGGRTAEHDVSIITGTQLIENADKGKYNIFPVYITRDGSAWYSGDELKNVDFFKAPDFKKKSVHKVFISPFAGTGMLLEEAKRGIKDYARIDAAVLAMHGMHGEDGTLQGLMELADIPYTSAGVTGSAVGMDKVVMKAAFRGLGFPVLDSVYFERLSFFEDEEGCLDRVERELGYPVVVKPANLGSSIGITMAHDRAELKNAVYVAANYDRRILCEKGVKDLMEINCAVLGNGAKAVASLCEEPLTGKEILDFKDKYLSSGGQSKGMKSLGRKIPADISKDMEDRIKNLSLDIFDALDMKGVVRIDYIIDRATDMLYVNEANTIPGSFAFYLFEPMGIKYSQLIDTLIECAETRASEKKSSIFSFESEILKKVGHGAKGAKGAKTAK